MGEAGGGVERDTKKWITYRKEVSGLRKKQEKRI